VAVPAVFWFFALSGLTAKSRSLASVALAACALALFQMVYSNNLLQAANHFARVHDNQLAAAIHARVAEAAPDVDKTHKYTIDVFGAKPFDTIYPRPFSSTAGFSFFEWDGGDMSRIVAYMRLIGYDDLVAATPQQRHDDAAVFAQMP